MGSESDRREYNTIEEKRKCTKIRGQKKIKDNITAEKRNAHKIREDHIREDNIPYGKII